MHCCYCGSRTRVVVTEQRPDGAHRWLRCLSCDASMRTLESFYEPPERANSGTAVFTADDIRRLRARAAAGTTYAEIATEFGVHPLTIYRAVNRLTYANVS